VQASTSLAKPGLPNCSRAVLALLLFFLTSVCLAQSVWETLRKDGIHDPKNQGIKQLQEPTDALSKIPAPDTTGNQVRWTEAIGKGLVQPRPSLKPGVEPKILDQDILLSPSGGMPMVLFPHKRHTQWLDCANCHDHLFKQKTGETKLSMFLILQGEQCGVCHGAVAFPLTECYRCHSVTRHGQQGQPVNLPPGIPKPPSPPPAPRTTP
jgi:c(7)-type cytochrome triheme protein